MALASINCFLSKALAQAGDRYVFGTEADLDDPDPTQFDCSELVQWAAHQCKVTVPDGSQNQRRFVTRMAISEAVRTRGALLGNDHHVAVSLGNGSTIEARGKAYGVGSWPTANRPWTWAGRMPGFDYAKEVTVVAPRFDPPLRLAPVVDALKAPSGGVWVLTEEGAIYAFDCPDYGAPNRHPEYWPPQGHPTAKAARLSANGDGYVVTAATGETFSYP